MWDPKNHYVKGILKEYIHWVLEVSFRQPTLGTTIFFAKENVERISQLSTTALEELQDVMRKWEKCLEQNPVFAPDHFNYLQLGNAMPHLHIHALPRYKNARLFSGKEWIDSTWGKPPKLKTEEETIEQVLAIRQEIILTL